MKNNKTKNPVAKMGCITCPVSGMCLAEKNVDKYRCIRKSRILLNLDVDIKTTA